MDFLKTNIYSEILAKQCADIAHYCNRTDNVDTPFFIDDEISSYDHLPWLYYSTDNSKMTGFISVYVLNPNEVEFCAFVSPDYRYQNIFTTLYDAFCDDYKHFTMQVSVTSDSEAKISALNSLGFNYHSSECKLVLDIKKYGDVNHNLELKSAITGNTINYSLLNNQIKLGTCTVSVCDNVALIHDVEIFEEYQRNGYGLQMLKLILNALSSNYPKAILHVTKDNVPAYEMYLKLGFVVTEELLYFHK